MKFYDRENELAALHASRNIAFNTTSQLTVVAGRRRIGKTKLILKSCEHTPTVYLFVSRNSEAALCSYFSQVLRDSLSVFVPEGIHSFSDLFTLCMEIAKTKPYNLVLDEFQEFLNINPSIYSEIQRVWDLNKDAARMHLIVSGSVYSLIVKIFQDYKEPLYGRATSIIRLKPFSVSVLKTILADYSPSPANDDLLALYAFTGGVPKYVEILMDNEAFTVEAMVRQIVYENSIFIEEGNVMLIQEFGKKYGNYYAILSAIASGFNEPSRITAATGQKSLGGSLQRLEEDYDIIAKRRPVGAKQATQSVRYYIKDHFLRFWFRYVVKYQNLVQSGQFETLRSLILHDYPEYSGHELEDYFRDKLSEEHPFKEIGSWWMSPRGKTREEAEQFELDIVGIYFKQKRALLAEVKRQRKSFKPEKFQHKVEAIKAALLANYEIETCCLMLEDM